MMPFDDFDQKIAEIIVVKEIFVAVIAKFKTEIISFFPFDFKQIENFFITSKILYLFIFKLLNNLQQSN